MMAGNFQQMGNAGGNPMMMMQQQQQQQAQGGMPRDQNIQHLILQQMRNQTHNLSGWQTTVTEVERLTSVWQLVTQLRLANPQAQGELTKHCRDAIQYEKGQFDSAPNKESYTKNLHAKLAQLTTARANNQIQQAQMGMANQGGAMGQPFQQGMQQLQNMQHLQQQMQPSPMQAQQQPQQMQMGGMGNNMMGQNMPQNPQFQMNMQQQQQQQAQMQAQQGGNRKQQELSDADRVMVANIMKQLIASTPDAKKQQIRAQLMSSADPAHAERWRSSGIDPLGPYFQQQATNLLQRRKAQQLAQASQQGGQTMSMGMNRPQGATPMQQQRSGNPNPMMQQPQQGQQPGMPGNPDFNFLDPQQNQNPQEGNPLGMQPSLSQQGNTTPQNMAGLPVQSITPNQQRQMNPQMRQQFNAQQQAAMQAAAQEKARRAQMAALQGQAGGLGPMPPNQSPAMNTLNAPLAGTPQQNAIQGNAMGQPGPSQFGQPIDPRFVMNQRPGVNGQITLPDNMTPEMRQRLSGLPPDKLNELLGKWNHANAQRAMNLQNQQNGLAGGMPGGGQMMQNPGGAHPQPGIQGMANPMNQFMQQNGQPMQRPTPQMMANMTPQQQAMFKQQMQQRQAQQMQNGGVQQPQMPADMSQLPSIDGSDFPQTIYTVIPRQMIPQGITKWGPLKQWIMANGAPAGLPVEVTMEKLLALQKNQMGVMIRNRQLQAQNQQNLQRQAQGLPPLGGPQPGQLGQQPLNPAMMAQLAQMQAMNPLQISGADIEGARQHPSGRWANFSDDQIRQHLITSHRNRQIQYLRQQQQMQNPNAPQGQQPFNPAMGPMPNMGQMPAPNMTPNGMQRPIGPPQAQGQQMPPQGMKRPQPNQQGPPAPKQQPQAQMEAKQTPQRAAKPNQPASSPAQPQNSKKRASSDDVVEVPNPNGQVSRPPMQPGQPGQKPPFPMLTQEQLAQMTPERRQKYIQAMQVMRQRQMAALGPQPTQQDMEAFHKVRLDEVSKWKQAPPVNLSPEERNQLIGTLRGFGPKIQQIMGMATKWFAMTRDEGRLRAFFRAYLSINDQFEDGAKAQRPKAQLSMRQQDLQQAMQITSGLVQDVANRHPEMMKAGPRPGQPGQPQPNAAGPSGQGQQQPGQGPAPLNAANLQQQQQALSAKEQQNKQQMQRASMGGKNQPPPAPTTAQAPNAQMMGQNNAQQAKPAAHHASPVNPMAVNSPQGVPAMYGPAKIDQGQLKLPPNKRKKTEGGMTSSGNTPVQQSKPAPNTQQQSQPMMKQEPQNGQKPQVNGQQEQQPQKPQGFVCQDRDCEGVLPPFKTEEELRQHKEEVHVINDPIPYLMGEFGDYLALEGDKDMVAPAMKQSESTSGTGLKPSPKSTPQAKKKEELPKQEAWSSSGVDPSVLTQVFKPFEGGAMGAISNIDAYRSRLEMEDSPDSTESSKHSDPSDITEGVSLDLKMQYQDDWEPFGESDLMAFTITDEPDLSFNEADSGGGLEGMGNVMNEPSPVERDDWERFVRWEEPGRGFGFEAVGLFELDDGSWLA